MACINIVNYEVPIVLGLTTRPFTNHRLRHRRDRESNVTLLGPVVNAKFTVTRIGLWIMIKYSSSSYLDFDRLQRRRRRQTRKSKAISKKG